MTSQNSDTIRVVCAVIRDGNRYLACQRSSTMRDALKWEFPGGKIEAGETLFDALHREVREELSAQISMRGIVRTSRWEQKGKVIHLYPLLCTLIDNDFKLTEHAAFRWISVEDFADLSWCDADLDILNVLVEPGLEGTGWWR